MRVCHVFPSESWGGAEIQMIDIANWQIEAGLDVAIWCRKNSPIHKECLSRGLSTITDPLPNSAVFPPVFYIQKVLKREKITHLHIHWAPGLRVFMGIKLLYPVKIFFYTHMWISKFKKDPFHAFAYSQVDIWTVSGERAKKQALKYLSVKETQLRILPYGIDFRKFPKNLRVNGKTQEGLKPQYGLPENSVVLGFLGRIDKQKGVLEFLEAAGPLLKKFSKLHLLVVGDPTLNEKEAESYNREVEASLTRHQFENRIHRLPHQKDFLAVIACCDALVLPSYHESYSILIINSFASGVPVVSTNSGGTPDLIQEPKHGWLVPPRAIKELSEQLKKIVEDPAQAWSKEKTCKEYAFQHHDHQAVIKKLIQFYKN